MDATRLPFRSSPCLSGRRYGSNIHRRPATSSCKFDVSASMVIRSRSRSVLPSFADDGHATYYQSTPTATFGGSSSLEAKRTTMDRGGIKGRHSESKELKKQLKRVEGLLRSTVSTMVFGDEQGEAASFAHDHRVLVETSKRQIIQRLQQVKEAKRRRKAEKAVHKAAAAVCGGRKGMRMRMAVDSESSSSSSSESSDGERQGMSVLDMTRRCPPPVEAGLQLGGAVEERTDAASAKLHCGGDEMETEIEMGRKNNAVVNNGNDVDGDDERRRHRISNNNKMSSNIGGGRIELEVCMGGKCQRSGAGRLKVELERQLGLQGTVVGCKCMGRCKHGPNVRLRHDYGELSPSSICCVGVGLEDVPSLVSSLLVTNLDLHPLSA